MLVSVADGCWPVRYELAIHHPPSMDQQRLQPLKPAPRGGHRLNGSYYLTDIPERSRMFRLHLMATGKKLYLQWR